MSSPAETTTASTANRRERKRLQVHDTLYRHALDLFLEHGFEATTMDKIADVADVARGTVFNHYPQKVAFLEEWGRRRRAAVERILSAENVEALPASEQLRHYLREMALLNTASRQETVTLMDASVRFGGLLRDPALDVELTKVVEDGRRAGDLRDDVDPAQVGSLLAAGYFAAVLQWINVEPAPFDLAAYLDRMLDIVLRGVLAT
ncbi:MAG: TetR/AcrR family transcriptional regulator [Umezawaea sp.]